MSRKRDGRARPGPGSGGEPAPGPIVLAGGPARPLWLVPAGVWLAVAGAPLAWSTVFTCEYTLPKLLALSAGLLAASLGVLLALRRGRWLLGATPLDPFLWPLAGALALATLFSRDPSVSFVGRYNSFADGVWALGLCAGLYSVIAGGLDERQRRWTKGAALGAGALVGVYGVLQALGKEPFELSERLPMGRAVSTLGSPVHLGAYLAMLLPLAVSESLAPKALPRGLAAGALVLIAGCLLGTVSRGAWLAGLAGLAAYFALARGGKLWAEFAWRSRRTAVLAAAAALVLAGAIWALRSSGRPFLASDLARAEGWRVAWQLFLREPWLGHGPDTFEQVFREHRTEAFMRVEGWRHHHGHAHNDLLQSLVTTGFFGAAAYAGLWLALFLAARSALRVDSFREDAAALSGALLSFFISLKFNPMSVEVWVTGAALAGLLAGGAASPARDAGETAPPAGAWGKALTLFLAAAASTWGWGRLGLADRHFQKARVHMGRGDAASVLAETRRALALNPCELKYHMVLVNQLTDLVRAVKGLEARGPLLAEAEASGRKAALCHPRDVNAHYIYGYAALISGEAGLRQNLALAERELDAAIALDPGFLPLLELRLQAAVDTADAAKQRELAGRIEEVKRLVAAPG